jgi:hypothetical protein
VSSPAEGWAELRNGDTPSIDRRAVVASIDEIMSASRCTRAAFYRCVSILDYYVMIWGADLAYRRLSSPNPNAPPRQIMTPLVPSSRCIRGAIACAISVASKHCDIYPIAMTSLLRSLGTDIVTPSLSFEQMEVSFLAVLEYRLNGVTLDEVAESLLELHFPEHRDRQPPQAQQQQVPAQTRRTDDMSSLRSAAVSASTRLSVSLLTQYLCDVVIRSTSASMHSPCHLGAAVVDYVVTRLLPQRAHALYASSAPDHSNIDLFHRGLSATESARCQEVVMERHRQAVAKPSAFLERRYSAGWSMADVAVPQTTEASS